MNSKAHLRNKLISNIINPAIDEQTSLIKNLMTILSNHDFNTLGLYCAIFCEPNLSQVMLNCKDKNLALPKIAHKKIVFCKYNIGDNLAVSAFANLEPLNTEEITPEIILVPGLAFDNKGYRLGYGMGCYDRYLARLNTIKIGVCYNANLFNSLPNEHHDVKMDYVVTQNLILKIC